MPFAKSVTVSDLLSQRGEIRGEHHAMHRTRIPALITSAVIWLILGSAQSAADDLIIPQSQFAEGGTSLRFAVFEGTGGTPADRVANRRFSSDRGWLQAVREIRKDNNDLTLAGGDVLRSFLTLPSVADPNSITPSLYFPPSWIRRNTSSAFSIPNRSVVSDGRPIRADLHFGPQRMPRVRRPHLWAGLGTLLGGAVNMQVSGYRLNEFHLRFNTWESEQIALREQGADMVQHFILGYGLTRYFLDNGSSPLVAGVSAFAYEFVAGEVMESFPQAGGISWRDVAVNVIAVTVGALDHNFKSPIRFRAGSQTDVAISTPNEFDPYRFSLGIAVARIGGLELIAAVQNWKDRLPTVSGREREILPSTSYMFANY
jgi:hypothetical protein